MSVAPASPSLVDGLSEEDRAAYDLEPDGRNVVAEEPAVQPEPDPVPEQPVAPVTPAVDYATSTVEPETTTETPAAESAPAFDLIAQAKERGMVIEDTDTEDTVKARLFAAWQQDQAVAAQARQDATDYANRLAYLEQRARDQQVAQFPTQYPQQPAARKAWEAPPFDRDMVRSYRQAVVNPETQETTYDWKPNTPASVIEHATAYQQWEEKWQETVLHNPGELKNIFSEIAAESAREQFAAQQEQFRQEAAMQNYQRAIQANADKLYIRDPMTLKPTGHLSAVGIAYQNEVDRLAAAGVRDPAVVWDIASRLSGLGTSPSTQPSLSLSGQVPVVPSVSVQPARTPDQIKQEFRQKTAQVPSGSLNHPPQLNRNAVTAEYPWQPGQRQPTLSEISEWQDRQ